MGEQVVPLPVTVIGGGLGAGKTTLVNHLLRHAGGRRLAVLVNDFGTLAVDADLIAARADDLIAITGGCVCCSFGADLAAALGRMAGRNPRPDHLVIEASGVAIPSAIALSAGRTAEVAFDGLVVLVAAGSETGDGDLLVRQLSGAQIVLVTKGDLVGSEAEARTLAWVADQTPEARVLPVRGGAVPIEALLGFGPLDPAVPVLPHGDTGFESVVLTPAGALNPAALAQALARAPGVIRAKGLVQDRDGAVMLVQVVGAQWDVTRHKGPGDLGVVCIGPKGALDVAGLRALV